MVWSNGMELHFTSTGEAALRTTKGLARQKPLKTALCSHKGFSLLYGVKDQQHHTRNFFALRIQLPSTQFHSRCTLNGTDWQREEKLLLKDQQFGGLHLMISWGFFQPLQFCDAVNLYQTKINLVLNKKNASATDHTSKMIYGRTQIIKLHGLYVYIIQEKRQR